MLYSSMPLGIRNEKSVVCADGFFKSISRLLVLWILFVGAIERAPASDIVWGLTGTGGQIYSVAYSPSGDRIAYSTRAGIFVCEAEGEHRLLRTFRAPRLNEPDYIAPYGHTWHMSGLGWSPDEEFIAAYVADASGQPAGLCVFALGGPGETAFSYNPSIPHNGKNLPLSIFASEIYTPTAIYRVPELNQKVRDLAGDAKSYISAVSSGKYAISGQGSVTVYDRDGFVLAYGVRPGIFLLTPDAQMGILYNSAHGGFYTLAGLLTGPTYLNQNLIGASPFFQDGYGAVMFFRASITDHISGIRVHNTGVGNSNPWTVGWPGDFTIAAACSPGSEVVATAVDTALQIWDITTGEPGGLISRVNKHHLSAVRALHATSDGSRLISLSSDRALFNSAESGLKQGQTLFGGFYEGGAPQTGFGMAVSGDGRFVGATTTGSTDIWKDGAHWMSIPSLNGSVLAFSPTGQYAYKGSFRINTNTKAASPFGMQDGRCVTSVSSSGLLCQVKQQSDYAEIRKPDGSLVTPLYYTGQELWTSSFGPNGRVAILGTNILALFDGNQKKFLWQRWIPSCRTFARVAFSKDGKLVALTNADSSVLINETGHGVTFYDAATGGYVKSISNEFGNGVSSIAFSDDSQFLFVGREDGSILKRSVPVDGAADGFRIQTAKTSVYGGLALTGSIKLKVPAPAGGALVALSSASSIARVPETVLVPQGSLSATFKIETEGVDVTRTIRLQGELGVLTMHAYVDVLPAVPASLEMVSSIVGGNFFTCKIKLLGKAPSGGTVVELEQTGGAYLEFPASVIVTSGANYKVFIVKTSGVTENRNVGLRAAVGGAVIEAGMTLLPANLVSFDVLTPAVTGGSTGKGVLVLDGAAPPEGADVKLSSSNTSVAKVKTSVNIPAGSRKLTITVTTLPVSVESIAQITATYRGVTRSITIQIVP